MKQYRNQNLILTDNSYFIEAYLNRAKKKFGLGKNIDIGNGADDLGDTGSSPTTGRCLVEVVFLG